MAIIDSVINQGDSLSWTESDSNYPASDGWNIYYVLVNASKRITFNSAADGDDHDFDITAATTAAWTPGQYTYQRYVSDGTDRVTLTRGSVEIKPDFTTASDQRSDSQKKLDAIEAIIENRASLDQQSYTIAGRSITRLDIKDLLYFRDYYAAKVRKEKGYSNTIQVRF
jgi:hypothetical protein